MARIESHLIDIQEIITLYYSSGFIKTLVAELTPTSKTTLL